MAEPGYKIFKFEDAQTGKIIEIEGPEDATDEELYQFLEQGNAAPAPAPQKQPAPAQPTAETPPAPVQPVAAPASAGSFDAAFKDAASDLRAPDNTAVAIPQGLQDPDKPLEDWHKSEEARTEKARATVAAFGRALSKNPLAPEQVDAFVNQIATAEKLNPATVREAVDYYRTTPADSRIPGLMPPEKLELQQEADSAIVTAAKEGLRNSPGTVGALVGAAQANRMTPMLAGPPKLAATVGGALVGGFTGQSAGDAIALNALSEGTLEEYGLTPEQLAVNQKENPWSAAAGSVIPEALFLQPGRGIFRSGMRNQVIEGGVEAGVDAAVQGAQILSGGREELDWRQLATSAASGAILTAPTRLGKAIGLEGYSIEPADYSSYQFGEHITYDGNKVRAELMRQQGALTPDEVLRNPAIIDSPENRAKIEASNKAFAEGDTFNGRKLLSDLEVKRNNGLSQEQAVEHINGVLETLPNAPEVEVHSRWDDGTVPAHIGAKDGVLGAFDKDTGKIHIFADQLTDAADAQAVLFHESMHAGLAWQYKEGLDKLLLRMYENGSKDFKAAVDDWKRSNPDSYAHLTDPKARLAAQIEEVLADTGSRGPATRGMLDVVRNYIKDTARKAGMDRLRYSDREIQSILSMAHENVFNGGDPALGLGGVRYIYVGDKAEGLNPEDRAFAQDLYDNTDVDPMTIKQYTGWHKGPDGKYRFEISDEGSDLLSGYDMLRQNPDKPQRLEDVLYHPELYEKYPALAETLVYATQKEGLLGGFNSSTGALMLNTKQSTTSALETLLHEIQHSIQNEEEFFGGSNASLVIKQMNDKQYARFIDKLIMSKQEQADAADLLATELENVKDSPPYRAYKEAIRTAPDRDAEIAAEEKLFRALFGAEIKDQFSLPRPYGDIWFYLTRGISPLTDTIGRNRRLADSYENDVKVIKKRQGDRDYISYVYSVRDEAHDAYNRSYGELEAEDVANRRELTMEERGQIAPFERSPYKETPTEDIIFARGAEPAGVGLNARYARRGGTRNPGYDKRTEAFYDKHLSPETADKLHGLAKNLPARGVMPDADVIEQALELGLDINQVRKYGSFEDHSDYIVALKDLMTDSANRVLSLSRAFRAGEKTGAAEEKQLLEAIMEFTELRNIFDESRGNLGRTFRALRLKLDSYEEDFGNLVGGADGPLSGFEIGDGSSLTSENIREMARRIAESNNPVAQLGKEGDRFRPDAKSFIYSLYYNGLLGTLNTVGWTGPIGNASNMARQLFGDTIAAGVGKVRSLADPNAERMTSEELRRRYEGIWVALINPETRRAVVREFTAPAHTGTKNRWQSQQISHLPTSMVIEAGTRGLQAGDIFFRSLIETSNMYGLATRQAQKEIQAMHPGSAYGAHTDEIRTRTAQIMASPSKKLLQQVQKQADILLLQEKLTGAWKQIAAPGNIPYAGPLIMPIITTVANNLRRGTAELTGIPSAARLLRGRLGGKGEKLTGAEIDRELSKLFVAAVVMGGAAAMVDEDKITGLGPTDPRERAEWLLTHRPQTIKFGDTEYSYQGVEPFSTMLQILADTMQTAKRKMRQLSRKEEDSLTAVGWETVQSFLNATVNSSFLSGIRSAADSGDNMFEKLLLGTASPLTRIPGLSEYTEKSDQFARDVSGPNMFDQYMNRVQAKDAGIFTSEGREGLPIKVDALGRPVARKPEQEQDPTYLELRRLFDKTGVIIVGQSSKTPKGVMIDSQTMNTHNLLTGPAIKSALTAIINSPAYQGWTDDQRAQVLKKRASDIRRNYSKVLDLQMKQKDPSYAEKTLSPLRKAFADTIETEEDQ